MLLVTPFVLLA